MASSRPEAREWLVIDAVLASAAWVPDLTAIVHSIPYRLPSGSAPAIPSKAIEMLCDNDSLDKSFYVSQTMHCGQLELWK